MGWNRNDLTARTGSPLATFSPTGYEFTHNQNTQHVVYQGFTAAQGSDGHLYELYWDGAWHYKDLTAEAGAPLSFLEPTGYVFAAQGTQHVVYLGAGDGGTDGHIHELWWDDDGWHPNDLTEAAGGAPLAANVPAGYEFRGQHVVYRGNDSHIHDLRWDVDGWHHSDLTAVTGAPIAGGQPSAYVFKAQDTQHVIHLGTDDHVHELWWRNNQWHHNDLTLAARAPLASDQPIGYVFDFEGTQHVVYRGIDGHIHELKWTVDGWGHNDLTAAAGGAPSAAGGRPAGYVFDAQGTQHVDYGGTDGHIHELWRDSNTWHHSDLTAVTGAPATISYPAGYVFTVQGTQHVVYNADDHHIVELYWKP